MLTCPNDAMTAASFPKEVYTMPANKPEECDLLIAEAITAGDVEAAMSFYEPDAAFVAEPGKDAVVGTEAIRAVMTAFTSMKATLDIKVNKVVQTGDLALLHSEWSLTGGTGPDGNPVNMGGHGTEIVRQQPDGTWRFIIDNPFGAD